jgi:hypothetical protein
LNVYWNYDDGKRLFPSSYAREDYFIGGELRDWNSNRVEGESLGIDGDWGGKMVGNGGRPGKLRCHRSLKGRYEIFERFTVEVIRRSLYESNKRERNILEDSYFPQPLANFLLFFPHKSLFKTLFPDPNPLEYPFYLSPTLPPLTHRRTSKKQTLLSTLLLQENLPSEERGKD